MPTNNARVVNPWRRVVWGGATLLLALPWVAMQFTHEVAWDLADFILFGGMLFVACGTFELATRISRNRAYLGGVGVAVAAAFGLVWVNLAVGIIGSEHDPANLVFAALLALALVGAMIVRCQARGLAHVMAATAGLQGVVAVVARVAGYGNIFAVTALFVAMWLLSAWLFRRAARQQH